MVPPIIKDIERIISGLKLSGLPKPYLENLALMIKNGVQGNVLDLVALPGIGRKRALSLSEMGIKTPLDIIKNDKVARNILGPKLFMQVKDHIENPGKIVLKF
jgi:helicase